MPISQWSEALVAALVFGLLLGLFVSFTGTWRG